MPKRFSTSIQFRNSEEHKRLKLLAVIRDRSIGETLANLVDNELGGYSKAEQRKRLKDRPDLLPYV